MLTLSHCRKEWNKVNGPSLPPQKGGGTDCKLWDQSLRKVHKLRHRLLASANPEGARSCGMCCSLFLLTSGCKTTPTQFLAEHKWHVCYTLSFRPPTSHVGPMHLPNVGSMDRADWVCAESRGSKPPSEME
uniref:Uncharacterized protein n=1 Tax=Eutreptiella gymnastica TaxID=73025 RepID=A0A7S4G5X2_9EUGL